ncbi:MAG TPA: hypothetical protein VK932_02710 [Kofleriaceae bacterium]|nr:hypothetical protein [Kofleriaceae bacterium]
MSGVPTVFRAMLPDRAAHGTVALDAVMPLAQYEVVIAVTRAGCVVDEV